MIKTKIDTDQLGAFTGEVERKSTPLTCIRQKCELAMKESKVTIGVASEGSFGPPPFIPFFGVTMRFYTLWIKSEVLQFTSRCFDWGLIASHVAFSFIPYRC